MAAEKDVGEIIVEDRALHDFVQMPLMVVLDQSISAGAKVAYGLLLWYAWRGMGFPGQQAMGAHLGTTERSIRTYLRDLIENDYLEVKQHGLGRPNTYIIKSLQNRENSDRKISSGLAGNNLPVQAEENFRSLNRSLDSTTQTQQQEGLPGTHSAVPNNPDVVVASNAPTTTVNDNLSDRLIALGVTKRTAKKLQAEHPVDLIARWVAYTEHRLRTGWVPKETPAAWIVAAINSPDWVIPEWFRTPEEEEEIDRRRQAALAEETRRREEAEAVERQAAEAQRNALEEDLGIDAATRELWAQTLTLLQARGKMTTALFGSYLLPIARGVATVATAVEFFRVVIQQHAEDIRQALEEVSGRSVKRIEVRLLGETPEASGDPLSRD